MGLVGGGGGDGDPSTRRNWVPVRAYLVAGGAAEGSSVSTSSASPKSPLYPWTCLQAKVGSDASLQRCLDQLVAPPLIPVAVIIHGVFVGVESGGSSSVLSQKMSQIANILGYADNFVHLVVSCTYMLNK